MEISRRVVDDTSHNLRRALHKTRFPKLIFRPPMPMGKRSRPLREALRLLLRALCETNKEGAVDMLRCFFCSWGLVVILVLTHTTEASAQEAPEPKDAVSSEDKAEEKQTYEDKAEEKKTYEEKADPEASGENGDAGAKTQGSKRAVLNTEILRDAFVKVRSGPVTSFGVLMGDRKTVLFAGMFSEPGRDVWVRGLGEERWIEVPRESIRVYRHQRVMKIFIASLPEPAKGTPIPLGAAPLRLGQGYYVAHLIFGPVPVVSTFKSLVVSEYETGGDLAGRIQPGSLVLDDQGRLLGLVGLDQQAVEIGVVQGRAEALKAPVTPLFGLRLGPRFRGPAGTGLELRVEGGATFWDRLSLALHAGFSTTSEVERVGLEDDEWGRGMALADRNSFLLGAELRYRLLFFGTFGGGVYLDLAAGGEIRWVYYDPESPVLFSRDPNCDPLTDACPVTMRDGEVLSEQDDDTLIGMQFGADLRFGAFSMGYRYYPGVLWTKGSDSHVALFGFSFM